MAHYSALDTASTVIGALLVIQAALAPLSGQADDPVTPFGHSALVATGGQSQAFTACTTSSTAN